MGSGGTMAWEPWLGGLKDSKVKDIFNVSYTTSECILKDNCLKKLSFCWLQTRKQMIF